jgi:hypothetical protein
MQFVLILTFFLFPAKPVTYRQSSNHQAHVLRSKDYSDTLPRVLPDRHADRIKNQLQTEAAEKFRSYQLPKTKTACETAGKALKARIIKEANVTINHKLPLNLKETGSFQAAGYRVKNIVFQTRPNVYATANLYIPDTKGLHPAIITMHGHWHGGRLYKDFKAVGQTLALNGYVCLVIDAWGAGERTTTEGKFDYHGGNLGASIMDIGETLIGGQISDNIRGIDLLCSLPYVDTSKIGATGASGGGNQAMWLSAVDSRIKAAIPAVSVGTFESYIMERNCICELLPDGLTFTEESGVLALIAPHALKLFNSEQDFGPFSVAQMKRSYYNVRPVFALYGAEKKLAYEAFKTPHGYSAPMREQMIEWFNQNLKKTAPGAPVKGMQTDTLPDSKLLVYPNGNRDAKVENIATYCKNKGASLRKAMFNSAAAAPASKIAGLSEILRSRQQVRITNVTIHNKESGWERIVIETSDNQFIPLLYRAPGNDSRRFIIVSDPKGKNNISQARLNELKASGDGLVLVDLLGTGECSSPLADTLDEDLPRFHTIARSELWLGKTVLGQWVNALDAVNTFLKSKFKAPQITLDGRAETALAGLFYAVVKNHRVHIVLRDTPVSYLFDRQETLNNFSMAIHLPGFLVWGDVSLAAALSKTDVLFIHPVTMSGTHLNKWQLNKYAGEYKLIARKYNMHYKTRFIN